MEELEDGSEPEHGSEGVPWCDLPDDIVDGVSGGVPEGVWCYLSDAGVVGV